MSLQAVLFGLSMTLAPVTGSSPSPPAPEVSVPAAQAPPKPAIRASAVGVSAPSSRWKGEPISLSLRDADLVEVLRSFAEIAGINLVVQPGVKGSVTVELHEVPWDQALDVILRTQGLAFEIDGRVLSIDRR